MKIVLGVDKMAKDLIGVLLILFIAIVLVVELSKDYPEFAIYGWGIIVAYAGGSGYYFKKKYWDK